MFNRCITNRPPSSDIKLVLLKRLSGCNIISLSKTFFGVQLTRFINRRVDILQKTAPLYLTALTYVGVQKSSALSNMEESLLEILNKADKLFETDRFQESLNLLNTINDQLKAGVKWRQGRALYKICENNIEHRQELISQAFELVSEAVTLNYDDAGAHIWMAALLDAKSELNGIYTRLINLPEVKKYMLNAVKINPNDSMAWHCLGRFSYGIANATWHERQVIRYTGIVETYEQALESFLKAEQESPNFRSLNILYIGKCYDAMGDYENAKYYLTLAANVVVLNKDDQKCKQTAIEMLKNYSQNSDVNI